MERGKKREKGKRRRRKKEKRNDLAADLDKISTDLLDNNFG